MPQWGNSDINTMNKTLRYFEHQDDQTGFTLANGDKMDQAGISTVEALNVAFAGQGVLHEFDLLYPSNRIKEQIDRESTELLDDGTLRQDPFKVNLCRAVFLVGRYRRTEMRPNQAPLVAHDGPITEEWYHKLHGSLAAIVDVELAAHQFPRISTHPNFSKALQGKCETSEKAAN